MSPRTGIAGCLLAITLLTGESRAWAPAGHKIAASIAYRLIAPERRAEIAGILRRHPRYAEDFQAKLPETLPAEHLDEWIFQQASIWPDLARKFPPELKDVYHRGTWHYCNHPLFLTEQDRRTMKPRLKVNLQTRVPATAEARATMNVLQAIEYARSVALNRRASDRERALAFSWLFHLTGDIHQPLHSVSMFSQQLFPELLDGDRGGNLISTKQGERLHGLWDNFPGGDIKFNTATQRAQKFLHEDELKRSAEESARKMSPLAWFDESHELAREFAYDAEVLAYLKQLDPKLPPEDRPRLVLTEDYLKRGGLVARQRVVTAGYRLGKLLE